MAFERTLTIIKPNATKSDIIGKVIVYFEEGGLHLVALRRLYLTTKQAEYFYDVHKTLPFFGELVDFMTSGPIVALAFEGEDAVARAREIIGATDPKKAKKGTVRADLATSIEANTIHGSNNVENAKIEISFFFAEIDIIR